MRRDASSSAASHSILDIAMPGCNGAQSRCDAEMGRIGQDRTGRGGDRGAKQASGMSRFQLATVKVAR